MEGESKLYAVNVCKEVLDLSPDMNIQIDKVFRIVTQNLRGFVGMSKNTSQQSEHVSIMYHVNPFCAPVSKTDYGDGYETKKKCF